MAIHNHQQRFSGILFGGEHQLLLDFTHAIASASV
jgi:hypothetical protein